MTIHEEDWKTMKQPQAQPKQYSRPTVMITTYTRDTNDKNNASATDDQASAATKSDQSTNFFINNLRRPNARGRALSHLLISQIRGPTGSVRGHKDVVRKSLEGIKVSYSSGQTRKLPPAYINGQFVASNSLTTSTTNQSASISSSASSSSSSSSSCSSTSTFSSFYMNQRSLSSLNYRMDESYCQEYLAQLQEEEQDCCVAYTTTLGVIRRTFEDSKLMRSILNLNLIKYEERDIYLNQDYRNQLKLRLNSFVVPAIFVDGHHLGGVKELELLNENGDLQRRLAKFKMSSASREVCLCCGNARFIACPNCNGSRKSAIHHFKFNSIALRCIKCDENDGLVQCPACRWSPEDGSESGNEHLLINRTKQTEDENNNNDSQEILGENTMVISNGSASPRQPMDQTHRYATFGMIQSSNC